MPNNHCGRKECGCSHTGGCDRGFINLVEINPVTGFEHDVGVTPCRTCKEELSDIIETSWDREERARRYEDMRSRGRIQKVASRTA